MVVCHTAPCTTYTTILSNQEQASTTDHDVCRRIRCLYMFANSENTRRGCVLCQEHCFFAFKGLGFLDNYAEYAHRKTLFPAETAGGLHKKGGSRSLIFLRKRRQILPSNACNNLSVWKKSAVWQLRALKAKSGFALDLHNNGNN